MSETRINVSQTTITAEDVGASSAVDTMPIASASNLGKIVQYVGENSGSSEFDVAVIDPRAEIESDALIIDASMFKSYSENTFGENIETVYTRYRLQIEDDDSGFLQCKGIDGTFITTSFSDYRDLGITLNFEPGSITYVTLSEPLMPEENLELGESSSGSSSSGSYSPEPQIILDCYIFLNKNYSDIEANIEKIETSSSIPYDNLTIDSKVFANKVSQINGEYEFIYFESTSSSSGSSSNEVEGEDIAESQTGWFIYVYSPVGDGDFRLIDLSEYGMTLDYEPSNSDTMKLQLTVTPVITINGYFYKCINSGTPESDLYSWERVDVQPTPVIPDPLPSQTGNAGKFLSTDGTNTSWKKIDAITNTALVSNSSIQILGKRNQSSCAVNIGYESEAGGTNSVAVGYNTKAQAENSVSIGHTTVVSGKFGIAAGYYSGVKGSRSIAIGEGASANANNAIQFGPGDNNNMGSICFGYGVHTEPQHLRNYTILDFNGTIPTSRITKVNKKVVLDASNWSNNAIAKVLQTNGQREYATFKSIDGFRTISGDTNAIRNLFIDKGVDSEYLVGSGTITILIKNPNSASFKIYCNKSYETYRPKTYTFENISKAKCEEYGFIFSSDPLSNLLENQVQCEYSLSNMYNLAIDLEDFVATEQPSSDSELVEFVCNGDELSLYETHFEQSGSGGWNFDIDENVFFSYLEQSVPDIIVAMKSGDINHITIGAKTNSNTWTIHQYKDNRPYSPTYSIDVDIRYCGISITSSGNYDHTFSAGIKVYGDDWYKNGTLVDLNDYGISYSGRACNGDVLSVNYNKPSVIGGIQTVNVRGICEDGVVFPCPIPAHQNEYTNSGILCISQAEGSLTFECKTIPSQDITVSVVQL